MIAFRGDLTRARYGHDNDAAHRTPISSPE